MKKTFRTLLAGALALCAVACYDDSALQEDLAGVKEDLSALQAEFETFKKNLNDEVAALKTSYQTLNGSFTEYKGLNDNQVTALNTALNTLKGQLGADENSGIRGQIAEVISQLNAYKTEANGRLTTAEAAIEALKTDSALKTELEALAAKVDLKADAATLAALAETVESITVRGIKEENGKIVVTLANGETLSISKDGEGVVKVVNGNWVVVGADGTETDLDLPVSTPNLQFDIDWRTGDLYYSTDGLDIYDEDKEWISTGIAVSGGMSGDVAVIGRVDVWEKPDEYIKIQVDGDWFCLPVVSADGSSSATLEILAGKTIVAVGSTKTVNIKASGLADIYVMSKPDGWKASVEGNKLNISAPVEGNLYADEEGLILLHGTTEAGQCVVAKMIVTTKAGLEIIVDETTGKVTIKNALLMEVSGGMDDGVASEVSEESQVNYTFAPFYLGVIEKEMWERYSDYPLDNKVQNWARSAYDQFFMIGTYSDDYKVDVIETSVEEVYTKINDPYGNNDVELPEGVSYVMFAAPMDVDNYGAPIEADLTYGFYSPLVVSMEKQYATYNDVMLSLTRMGADYYYIGFAEAEKNGDEYVCDMETSFEMWSKGFMPELGVKAKDVNRGRMLLSEYASEGETSPLKPGTTYYAYAFPIKEGEVYDSYVEDFLPYVKYFTTNSLTSGGEETVTIVQDEDLTGYTKVVANLSLSANAETVYYCFYNTNPVDLFEGESDWVADILENGSFKAAESVVSVEKTDLSVNQTIYIAAFVVDSEGQYGDIKSVQLTSDDYPFNESMSVTVKSVSIVDNTATVVFGVTGADYLMVTRSLGGRTPYMSNTTSVTSFYSRMMSGITNSYILYYPVENGEVTITYSGYNATYKYSVVSAFNKDGNTVTSLSNAVVTDLSTWTAVE